MAIIYLYISIRGNETGKAYWKQTIFGVESCKTYRFSAYINVVEDSPELDFRIGGQVIASVSPRGQIGGNSGPDVWQRVETTIVTTNDGSLFLELANTAGGCNGNDIKLDDVSFREILCDTDGDGLANSLDLDSDNDGIPDAVEACGDTGVILLDCSLDDTGATYGINSDGCNSGVIVGAVCTPIDTDGDDIPDFIDLDSDDDGCPDSIESGSGVSGTSEDSFIPMPVDDCGLLTTGISGTCPIPSDDAWINAAVDSACLDCSHAESGVADICELCNTTDGTDQTNAICFLDCDGGGVSNAEECDAGNNPLDPCDDLTGPDKDGDGVPDSVDLDSDNDGIPDVSEGIVPVLLNNLNGTNSSNGGIIVSSDNYTCPSGLFSTSSTTIEFGIGWNNGVGGGFSSGAGDTESILTIEVDGVAYWQIETPSDGSSNNDNATDLGGDAMITVLNGASFVNSNPSAQGQNYIDHSTFNDWTYSTISMTVPVPISSLIEVIADLHSDDHSIIGFEISGGCAEDTDGDGVADYLDLDSDNDGIPDAIEACGDIALTLEDCMLDNNGDATYDVDPLTGCSTGVVMGSAACSLSPAYKRYLSYSYRYRMDR